MEHHKGNQEKSVVRSDAEFVKEMEKFLYQAQTRRRISGEWALIAQDINRIFAEIADIEVESISLLKQLERVVIEINSPIIAANHKKPGQKKTAIRLFFFVRAFLINSPYNSSRCLDNGSLLNLFHSCSLYFCRCD